MHEADIAMTTHPFQLAPDGRVDLDTPPCRATVAALLEGLARGDQFLVLTGEVGAGKTTVARRLLKEVGRDRFAVAGMSSLGLDADLLLRGIAAAFGVAVAEGADLMGALQQFLVQCGLGGREAVLIIDDAQDLDAESLRRLARLTAGPAGGLPVLHVCLVGRHAPLAFDALLRLGQPLVIGTACCLRALDAAEAREYILHRLRRTGWSGAPAFGAAATEAIHARCGGLPGRINLLADRVLAAMHEQGAAEAGAELVGAVDERLKAEVAGQSLSTTTPPVRVPPERASGGVTPSASFAAPPVPSGAESAANGSAARRAVSSTPVGAHAALGVGLGGTKTFAIADFPVLHPMPPEEPPAPPAPDDAAGPADVPTAAGPPPAAPESLDVVPGPLPVVASVGVAGEPPITPPVTPPITPIAEPAAARGERQAVLPSAPGTDSAPAPAPLVPLWKRPVPAFSEKTAVAMLPPSSTDAHLAAAASVPTSGRRRLLPAVMAMLVLVGIGGAWTVQRWDSDADTDGPAQRGVQTETDAAGNAPNVAGRSIATAPTSAGTGPSAALPTVPATTAPPVAVQPKPEPSVAVQSMPTPPVAAQQAAANAAVPPSLPSMSAAPADRPAATALPTALPAERLGPAVAADSKRVPSAVAGANGSAGRAAASAGLRVAPEDAPPTAAGPAQRTTGIAATEPAPSRTQRPAPGDMPVAVAPARAATTCTAAAQSMGLCALQPSSANARQAAPQQAALDAASQQAVGQAVPRPCEPAREALGLCPDR